MNGKVFSSKNYKLLGASVVLLVIGYIFLMQGPVYNHLSWTVAPLILVFVYCVMLPLTIILKDNKKSEKKR